MAVKLPSGTVTFLFTDVEGSTRLLDELGPEAYAVALADHRRVIREIVAREGGVEVDTQGDAFFFSFPIAPAALSAAGGVIDALATRPIRVRIGVNTGTPLLTKEGYVGADVHRAARIAAAGHGGQILVSAATAALVGRDGLRNLGEHRFKDLAAAERVWQLGDGDFPPLKSLYQTNLPVPGTPFLGRERELAEVVELLTRDDVGLLTLTGPGGTGKTRLALQAGADTAERFPDGLWWISLAALGDPALAISAVAEVLGVRAAPGRPLRQTLTEALAGRRCLLLLDNAEHLLPGVAMELAEVRTVDGPTLLVTSRERLQLQGEHLYEVPALAGPDAIALFLARASALNQSSMSTGAVAGLCGRLDRLPLAIELAAARTRLFSPEQLLERLGQRLDLLKGGRDADPRQQTLRATIQWSHDLLGPDEQALFQRLAIFVGGCTYAAAEAVCNADPETLQSLVDKSLLGRRDDTGGEPRLWMLETIREYAAERLEAAGESEVVRRRHAEYLVEIARKAHWDSVRFDWQRQKEGLAVLDLERDNLNAAVQWTLDRGSGLALPLTAALHSYWLIRGTRRQGLAWLEQALALPPRDASPDRAEALTGAALLARLVGDFARALQYAEEAIEVGRAAETPVAVVTGLNVLVTLAGRAGDFDRASAHYTHSVQAARAAGSMRLEALALFVFAETALHAGRYADARHAGGRALELFRTTCDQEGMALALARLGLAAVHEGRLREAAAQLDEALQCVNLLGFAETGAWCCEGLALVAASSGEPLAAARLLGAAETLRQVGGGVIQPAEAAARG